MTVIRELAFSGVQVPMDHPRIGWRSIAGDAISGGDATGYPAANAMDVRTALGWIPNAATGWIGIDAGDGVAVDYVGIAGHNLGSRNATIAVEYWNGTEWVGIQLASQVSGDDPILVLFFARVAERWRVRILSADAAPRIGHVRFGLVTEVPQRTAYGGTTPISESRFYQYDTLRSNNGAFMGRSIVATGLRFSVTVEHTSEDWRRSEWAAFRDYANIGNATFFYADRPGSYPEDIAYAWSNNALSAQRGIANKRISGEFTLQCEAL